MPRHDDSGTISPVRAPGGSRSRLISLTLAITLVSVACSSGESVTVDDSPAPSTTGPLADPTETPVSTSTVAETIPLVPDTAWNLLMDQIGPEGEISLDLALQAFALAIGPLPGVDTPDGDPGIIESGTGPVRWVLRYWDMLTPEQQSAVEAYLPSPDIPEAGLGIPSTLLAMNVSDLFTGYLAGAARSAFQVADCLREPELDKLLADVQSAIETGFGRELTASVQACRFPDDTGIAYAVPYNIDGGVTSGAMFHCVIVLPHHAGDVLTFDMAYGFFNCFQAELMTIDSWLEMPPWLIEGSAYWAATKLADPYFNSGTFHKWLTQPGRRLFSRSNDAFGFYSLMEDANVKPETHIDQMLTDWLAGGNEASYGVATAAEQMLDEWGPGYFADQTKGDAWFFSGPGLNDQPDGSSQVTVGNGDKEAISSVPYAATPTVAVLSADVVVFGGVGGALGLVWEGQSTVEIVSDLELRSTAHANLIFTYEPFLEDNDLVIPAPHGRIYLPDGSDKRLTEAIGTAYCMLPEGCECPEGSPGDNRTIVPGTDAFAYIGITGHTNATDFVVEGHSLETYCEIAPAGTATYVLTGGNWTYQFHGGAAVNGCIWPSISASGTFSYDPDAHLDIDTSQDPPTYSAYARTKEKADPVTVQECYTSPEVRKYETFEYTSAIVGAVWFFAGFGDSSNTFSGDTISGGGSWGGDPANHASWTLTRSS